MKFRAIEGTEDGRITRLMLYYGQIVYVGHDGRGTPSVRICVFDNKQEWMTFNPKIFIPVVK